VQRQIINCPLEPFSHWRLSARKFITDRAEQISLLLQLADSPIAEIPRWLDRSSTVLCPIYLFGHTPERGQQPFLILPPTTLAVSPHEDGKKHAHLGKHKHAHAFCKQGLAHHKALFTRAHLSLLHYQSLSSTYFVVATERKGDCVFLSNDEREKKNSFLEESCSFSL